MSRTCTQCEIEKAVSHFARRGRGLSTVCKACEGKEDGEKVLAARVASPSEDQDLKRGPALSIDPGLGVVAWIENGALQLAQGDDVVALSKTEAKVLFAQFSEWCGMLSAA